MHNSKECFQVISPTRPRMLWIANINDLTSSIFLTFNIACYFNNSFPRKTSYIFNRPKMGGYEYSTLCTQGYSIKGFIMYIQQTFELLAGFCPWWAEEPSTLRPYPVIAKKNGQPGTKKA